jgi:peptidoglycan/LPS O-acetylase OafA/YrhL
MHTTTDNVTPRQPALARVLIRSWEYRKPRTWVRVRIVLGTWNLVLGVLLVALGHWRDASFCYWLAAIPLVGAALIFWTANHLQDTVQS